MFTADFSVSDLEPELKFIFLLWKSAAEGGRFPRLTEFGLPNAEKAPNVLSIFEIERTDAGSLSNFKAIYARSKLSNTLRSKLVGTRLTEHPGKGPGSLVWSCFAEVAGNPRPLMVSLPYVGPLPGFRSSNEVFLPLLGEKDAVEFVLVGVVLLEREYWRQ